MGILLLKTLNPPGDVGYLKANYDKLLHITGTFTVMSLLSGIPIWSPPVLSAFVVVFTLQVAKTVRNYVSDGGYNPTGDWICNIIGYSLYAITRWL